MFTEAEEAAEKILGEKSATLYLNLKKRGATGEQQQVRRPSEDRWRPGGVRQAGDERTRTPHCRHLVLAV